jgi:Kdo2-lipid IVA lauroyltransferase/acyltransferase
VPHLHVLSSLSRRIDRLPGLRDRLWQLEGDMLARIWRSLGAGDLDAASDRGERLGRLIGPRLRKQQHVLHNLATAFPHWSKLQVEATAPRVWGTLGHVLVEYACLECICDPAEGRVQLVDLGGVRHVRDSGRPGIFVAPHLANWNLLPIAAVPAGIPLSVVYRRQSNPAIEGLMTSWRAALGCGFLEVGEASRGMLRELRQGRSVGLLMDQRYDRGEKLPFFGVPATTTLVPARLALRLDVPLIPARIERRGGARFMITVHHPVVAAPELDREAAARDMTAQINTLFARWITAAPDQWLCVKRRWPRPRPYLPGGGKVSTT